MLPSGSYPTIDPDGIPWLTVEQMGEADRLAIEDFGIGLLQMMEHAGSALAELVHTSFPTGRIAVAAGGGNNGGGGLCAARHLVNRGRDVAVVLSSDRIGDAAAHHLATLTAMGIDPNPEPPPAEIVVDAMVGYGLQGELRGRSAELAGWFGDRVVVSLDFPSGHGEDGGVVADATLTLALPKHGLRGLAPLFVADLGLPRALWSRLGLDVENLFAESRIVEVVADA